jgi:fructosamine-3-kinase
VYHTEFGWSSPNYIGSLPQSNKVTNSWASFYQEERLQPQLQLALDKKWLAQEDVPSTSLMMEKLQQLLPAAKPSLLHGDLWGGNYLISASGIPYLIDPAVYYGHQEVDLAMTRLFGGFDTSFYDAYNELLPPNDGWQDRTGLYQLYYLLVHLNLFGSSYLNSVLKWLRYYF